MRPVGSSNSMEPPAPHWADASAQSGIERHEAAHQEREDRADQLARKNALVDRDGGLFFQRVAAEMEAAAQAFNLRVGFPALHFQQSPTGLLSLRSVEGWYVLIAPSLGTQFANGPGAMVTERSKIRNGQQPYDLVMEGSELRMWVNSLAVSAEGFARHALEPWLLALPLGGR